MHTLGALAVTQLNILKRTMNRVTSRALHAYLGCIGCDGVEYIDKNKIEGDK
jgi:hypothetical protein